ncbi:MAG: hypothetical protein JO304_26800, partial [Solirubrobacterales bacterium]|nr:hypothetical protein [Solirubrobacterales bacterium]
ESEMELAYAGLHQLCGPFLDRIERLPAPQRHALGTAFGLRDGEMPDRFLVGLAVLSLFSDLADDRPLICIADDAQWLDAASAQALAFVARRLGAESVGLVFGVRETGDERHFVGLPELSIGGLDDRDAHELLATLVTGPLDERVRDRIVAETRGNPLALLELPGGLTPAELAGGFGLSDGPALSGGSSKASEKGWRRCRLRRGCCFSSRPPSRWGIRCWCGGRPQSSGSDRTRPRRRPCRDWSISARRCGSVIRLCVRRCTGGRRRRSASAFTGRWPRPPMSTSTRIAALGTWRMRRLGSTRTSLPSWSARPAERGRVAAWPRGPHFTSARSS